MPAAAKASRRRALRAGHAGEPGRSLSRPRRSPGRRPGRAGSIAASSSPTCRSRAAAHRSRCVPATANGAPRADHGDGGAPLVQAGIVLNRTSAWLDVDPEAWTGRGSPPAGRPPVTTTSPLVRASAAHVERQRRNRGASWTQTTSGPPTGSPGPAPRGRRASTGCCRSTIAVRRLGRPPRDGCAGQVRRADQTRSGPSAAIVTGPTAGNPGR